MGRFLVWVIFLSLGTMGASADPFLQSAEIEANPPRAIQKVRDFFQSGDFRSDSCVDRIAEINRAFLGAQPTAFWAKQKAGLSSPQMLAGVEQLTSDLWALRQDFRLRLRDFDTATLQLAVRELRQFNRVLNFSRAYILDARQERMRNSRYSTLSNEAFVWSDSTYPRHVTRDQIYLDPVLRSGDILVFAGSSSLSALIRVLADDNLTDSHVGVIYENESGEKFIVHALVEPGRVIMEPTSALEKKFKSLGSLRVYRHPNEELAKRAGEEAFKMVGTLYDFRADPDHPHINCVELSEISYRLASEALGCEPPVLVPEVQSVYTTHSEIRDRIGMPKLALAPGDIDLHRELDLIAEVVNPTMLIRNMRYDAAADSVLEALADGHRLRNSFLLRRMAPFLRNSFPLRFVEERSELIASQLDRAFPTHMPGEALETMLMFDRAVKSVLEARIGYENAFRHRHRGLGPTYPWMRDRDHESIYSSPRVARWLTRTE
jgi:hypothetical protein